MIVNVTGELKSIFFRSRDEPASQSKSGGGSAAVSLWLIVGGRVMDEAGTVTTADLPRIVVEVAAAARGPGTSRHAMQNSIAALHLTVVIDDRLTTAGVRAEDAVLDLSAAAHLGRLVVGSVRAAGVVAAVDDGVTAATRVDAVRLLQGRSVAAAVRLVVVDLRSATGRVAAVRTVLNRAPAAERSSEVVDGRVATTRVQAVRLGSDDTATANMGFVVVGIFSTAAGVSAETPASQRSTATDVIFAVVHLAVAAAVRVGSVDLRSAAARIQAVDLVARNVARTAEMVPGAVHESATAARVVGHQGLDAPTAHATAPVVYHPIAATRPRPVCPITYAVAGQ